MRRDQLLKKQSNAEPPVAAPLTGAAAQQAYREQIALEIGSNHQRYDEYGHGGPDGNALLGRPLAIFFMAVLMFVATFTAMLWRDGAFDGIIKELQDKSASAVAKPKKHWVATPEPEPVVTPADEHPLSLVDPWDPEAKPKAPPTATDAPPTAAPEPA
jgi:hypothetical protein